MNKTVVRIIGINLLVLLLYNVGGSLIFKGDFMGESVGLVSFHVLLCLVLGFVLLFSKDKKPAIGFFISSFLVLLIGFATCASMNTLRIH